MRPLYGGRATFGIVGAQELGSTMNAVAAVEMTTDLDSKPGAGAPSGLLFELKHPPVQAHRVVPADSALALLEEDLIQVDLSQLHKGTRWLRRLPGKLLVVDSDVAAGDRRWLLQGS